MQSTHTSVVARRVRIAGDYATLPHEAGWASEAVFFVQAEGEHPELTVRAQVSPDGINWIDRAAGTLPATESLMDLTVCRFGNWLRLTVSGAAADAPARVLIHLNLKG